MIEVLYRAQLIRLNRAPKEKREHFFSTHDNIFLLYVLLVHMILRGSKPIWKHSVSPEFTSSDYHMFRSEKNLTFYEDTKNLALLVDSLMR